MAGFRRIFVRKVEVVAVASLFLRWVFLTVSKSDLFSENRLKYVTRMVGLFLSKHSWFTAFLSVFPTNEVLN